MMKFRLNSVLLDEPFVDDVLHRAGGYRISDRHKFPDGVKNCDYRCGDLLIELKFLEKEVIEVPERQKKLAALFAELGCAHPEFRETVEINKLPPYFRRKYWDIYLSGLKSITKSANRQIRETKQCLGLDKCRGAIFIVNKECETIDPATTRRYVEHLISNEFSSLDYVITFTAIPGVMDGHERPMIEYYNTPTAHESDAVALRQIHDRFHAKFQECMGKSVPIVQSRNSRVMNLRSAKGFESQGMRISLASDSLSHVPGEMLPPGAR